MTSLTAQNPGIIWTEHLNPVIPEYADYGIVKAEIEVSITDGVIQDKAIIPLRILERSSQNQTSVDK